MTRQPPTPLVARSIAPLTTTLALALGLVAGAGAQEAVRPSPDAERLFTSPDPKLHANKQAAYGIVRELLEAGHWDRADRYLTERYLQHNPNAASGRAAVVRFFVEVMKVRPQPLAERLRTPIVAVIAEGDLVTVLYPRVEKTPDGRTYSTTWFDTWRFVDGKADEHWDSALVGERPRIAAP